MLVFIVALVVPHTAAAQGPAQHTESVAVPAPPSPDESVLTASLGATLSYGNTRSLAGAAALRLALRRGVHQVGAELQASYAASATRTDGEFGDLTRSAESYSGRLRYDFFLTDDDALFASSSAKRDTFAGLDSRVQVQAGYLRNLYRAESHRLWAEAGYDLSLDNFDPDPLLDDMMMLLPGSATFHSARVFLGYDNHVSDRLTYLTGVEGLLDVQDPENVRVTWKNELRSNIGGNFALGLNFDLGFDHVPVEGNDPVDTTTILNLTYTWKAEAAQPEPEGT